MYAKKYTPAGIFGWGILSSILFLGLTAVPAPAHAEGLYAGVNYGTTKVKDGGPCSTMGLVLNSGYSCSGDNKDNGWKLFAGYEAMEYLAFEISYLDFGKFTATGSGAGKNTSTPATASSDFRAKGWISFDVVGMLPVTKEFGLIGRVGINRWRVDNEASASDGSSIGRRKDTKPGFAFDSIGIGVKYGFTDNMDMRLEWERFKDVGDTLLEGSGDIDMLSLGLVYKFK